jgi:hypothetical protein
MRDLRLAYIGFASALALGVNGCASTPPPAKLVEVRPVHTAAPSPDSTASNLYQAAVSAIGRRDYVRALDLLQAARDSAPQDARVLNAFGVVYDKLGRFDLSNRYYAQAQTADPGSSIVAENRAYSDVLQGRSPPPVLASQAAVAPSAQPARPAAARVPALATVASTPSGAAPVVAIPASSVQPIHASPAVASAQLPAKPQVVLQPVREAPRPQAAPVSLTALAVRTVVPPKAPELKRLPSTVGLAIRTAPTVPMQPAVAPLQAASIAVAPAAMASAQPLAPAKPLAVARPQPLKEATLPAMTLVALKTAGPALVIPAQATRAELAVRPMQIADATTLHRVSLPTFQPLADPSPREPTPNRAPLDRPSASPATSGDLLLSRRLRPPAAALRPVTLAKAPATLAEVHRPAAPPASRVSPMTPPGQATAIQRAALAVAPARVGLRAAITPSAVGTTRAAPPVASSPKLARAGAAFIGRALVIIDASGRRGSANAMRLQLAHRGWTVPGARLQTIAPRRQTTIRYAAAHAVVARALANSFRFPVRLERCVRSCQGVSLILGTDARVPGRTFRTAPGQRRLS